ncbi:MAG: heme ABC transporter ATP-binding protein [Bacteroidetes bacterium]|nr:heme ABC transporter ATP-binding protein [Bacteroidota bacterium]
MLKAQNITYSVGNKVLLDNVSVDFEAGKLHLIIGPNGAGKSTLIKVLCNQLQLKSGSVYYGNHNSMHLSISEQARMRAVLSQNIELAFPLTVKEIVMMGRYPHFTGQPTSKDEIACEDAMRFFDVIDMANRNYMTLSGGEKQRVHFARVVAQIWYPVTDQFRYLILDEPLTFLDVHYQFDFMHKLIELLKHKDIIIVGVVHDLNLAAKFADNIVLLHQGKLLASGNRDFVLSAKNIKTAYQLEPVIHYHEENMYLFF